jgi:hypothetical protein
MRTSKRNRIVALSAATLVAGHLGAAASWAKVDLVTLPVRDKVQLTIYNTADLTLARDTRSLTMKKGANRLQFSWANTLIDPTSLEMLPLAKGRDIVVQSLEYPPRVTGLGIWNLDSSVSGKVPFEITYFTSGISWRAYYLATLAPDESAVRLEGYVRVTNNSGEDYENAETRLIVGKINLLDQIADLARRPQPYGRPGEVIAPRAMPAPAPGFAREQMTVAAKAVMMEEPKEIRKEGLSEYFLYTIEGTEDVPNGWAKRLISFTAETVPVKNLYRYEEEKHGKAPVRFLSFANDREHRLGKEPIPDGLVKVFRRTDKEGRLSYVGAQDVKYIPKGGEVDLNLGATDRLSVKPTLMEYTTDNYEWHDTAITGWDEHRTWRVEVANYRDIPVKVEIRRNFAGTVWTLSNEGDYGAYEKVDADTVQYTLELPPNARKVFTYRHDLRTGSRANR